jgi:hypothetical protein
MNNNKQQSPVDILFTEILELLLFKGEVPEHLKEAHKKAKELEKERMIEFGELCWKNLLRSDVIMRPRDVYNETYGGNK